MGKRVFKSFEELKQQINNDAFEKFKMASIAEKKRILSSYGLKDQGKYKGIYQKRTNTAIIEKTKNPFTDKLLEVKLIDNPLPISNKTIINCKLLLCEDNGKLMPDTIFTGKFTGLEEWKNKKRTKDSSTNIATPKTNNNKSLNKDHSQRRSVDKKRYHEKDGLPVYSITEAETEKNKNILQSQAKDRKIRQEERQKQEAYERTKQKRQRYNTIDVNERNDYKCLINDLRKKYGFEGFVHYTTYENLKSIMNFGFIMSRNDMIHSRLKWDDMAEEAVITGTSDNITNKVRLSYGFNTPISFRFEQRAQKCNTEMVAIVINPLICFDLDVAFYEKSAARDRYGDGKTSVKDLKSFNWNMIFERGAYTNESEKDNKKKFRNAEIVIDGIISKHYFDCIYFRSSIYLKRAEKEMGPDKRFRLGRININKHFSPGV